MSKLTKGMKWSNFTGKPHWTQTAAGKRKMAKAQRKIWREKRSPLQKPKQESFQRIIKAAVASRRGKYKKASKQTSLVVNGWRIILGSDEIRIDHE